MNPKTAKWQTVGHVQRKTIVGSTTFADIRRHGDQWFWEVGNMAQLFVKGCAQTERAAKQTATMEFNKRIRREARADRLIETFSEWAPAITG